MTTGPPAFLGPALAQVRTRYPVSSEVELLTPVQQGAVGHVVGLTDRGGTRYILKTYAAAVAGRAVIEARALELVGGHLTAAGARVDLPRLLLADHIEATDQRFLLMSRLAGTRWAELRDHLAAADNAGITRQVGVLMRALHTRPGPWFGDLVGDGPTWPSAYRATVDRLAHESTRYRSAGGSGDLAEAVAGLPAALRRHLPDPLRPALCHNDFIGGNLMIEDARITGVFDFEKATWDDPLRDLARTRIHVDQHDPALVPHLLHGYGALTAGESIRLDLYEVEHLMSEWTWVQHDRPPGWRISADRLDRRLRDAVRDLLRRTGTGEA